MFVDGGHRCPVGDGKPRERERDPDRTRGGRAQFGIRAVGTRDNSEPTTVILATRPRGWAATSSSPNTSGSGTSSSGTSDPGTADSGTANAAACSNATGHTGSCTTGSCAAPPAPPNPAPPPAPAPPTPAPPTPAPPAPKAITLSGEITSMSGDCPSVTYVIKGRTVVTTSATDFQKGSCSSVKPGKDVQVQGVELTDGTIRADVVVKQ